MLERFGQFRARLSKNIFGSPIFRTIFTLWMQLSPPMRAIPMHMWRAIKNYADNDTRQAAALSYYAVFSVFPLTLLMVVGVSALVGPTVAREQIVRGLILFLPEETDTITLFQNNIEDALAQNTSFGLLAFVGLIWSALGLFSNLTSSLDRIFQVPASRAIWVSRSLAFAMTLALIALIVLSFITSGVLRLVDAFFLANTSLWVDIGTFFLPFGLNMVIFVLLFRYVPNREVHWDAVWPGAIFGSLGFELSKALFALYLNSLETFQIVYGGIATVIVLMLWAYLVASVFLIAAEICSQINLWLIEFEHDSPRVSIITDGGMTQLPAELPPPA